MAVDFDLRDLNMLTISSLDQFLRSFATRLDNFFRVTP